MPLFAIVGRSVDDFPFTIGPFDDKELAEREMESTYPFNCGCFEDGVDCECDTAWVEEISEEQAVDLRIRNLCKKYPGVKITYYPHEKTQPIGLTYSANIKAIPTASELRIALGSLLKDRNLSIY